jgi:hypothetical protein
MLEDEPGAKRGYAPGASYCETRQCDDWPALHAEVYLCLAQTASKGLNEATSALSIVNVIILPWQTFIQGHTYADPLLGWKKAPVLSK